MKKVIFLDVDGVLSCFGVRGLCATRLDLFASIVKMTGALVVLSSMWRIIPDNLHRLIRELGKRGIELEGMTPVLPGEGAHGLLTAKPRGDEIQAWLDAQAKRVPVRRFVILDDDPNNEMGDLKPCLVKTDGSTGLTPEIADKIIRLLND